MLFHRKRPGRGIRALEGTDAIETVSSVNALPCDRTGASVAKVAAFVFLN
jgi:hypothetical protein